jgi:hypothetical protein
LVDENAEAASASEQRGWLDERAFESEADSGRGGHGDQR